MRVIRNKSVVHKLFTEIAEQMEQREGGYTRIVKIAPRRGDGAPAAPKQLLTKDAAPAAIIELVTEPVSPKQAVVKEAEAATKVAAEEAPVVEEAPVEAQEATAENAE